jgi:glycosyltransferase involved in cell wall biosynthesis
MYSDLALEFGNHGHEVSIIAPTLEYQKPGLYKELNMSILRVKVQESNNIYSIIKKGIALSLMPYQYKIAYKKYLKKEVFDLIIMPTPPITLIDFAKYIKKKTSAKFYLILRDIHPQSFHSVGYFRKIPIVYLFFNSKAHKAYKQADYIGCMSPGNMDFMRSIVSPTDKGKIVLLPNWQKSEEYIPSDINVKEKYGLKNKFIAIFGGTIGAGQEILNIITLAKYYKNNENIVFLVVGKGIRKQLLVDNATEANLKNILFIDFLPREEYNNLLKIANVGIISLDHRYTVPTCPSKIIGYMAFKIPVIAMINKGSDYGQYYIEKSNCGLWSEDLNNKKMIDNFDFLYRNESARMKYAESGYKYYIDNLTSKNAYNHILQSLQKT